MLFFLRVISPQSPSEVSDDRIKSESDSQQAMDASQVGGCRFISGKSGGVKQEFHLTRKLTLDSNIDKKKVGGHIARFLFGFPMHEKPTKLYLNPNHLSRPQPSESLEHSTCFSIGFSNDIAVASVQVYKS